MSEQIIGRLLPEWLNSNQHRAYPLDESTVGNGLPFSLLVDALFINSYNVDRSRLYLREVVVSGDNVQISMGGFVDGVETDFGAVAIIPFNTEMGTHIPIDYTGDSFKLSGDLVVGNVHCMDSVNSVITLNADTGKLFPGCVRNADEGLFGIKVGDTVYTGVVTLEAGDGIDFEVEHTDEETVLRIVSTVYTPPDENMTITDDASLLETAISMYGTPVRTICGISPDSAGDIVLSTPASGDSAEQYVTASGGGDGTIYLTIANDMTDTSCNDPSLQIESILQSLSNLNERAGDQHEMLLGLEEAVSNLALQVSRV